MEYTQWDKHLKADHEYDVLILVVMEYTQWASKRNEHTKRY